MSDHFDVRALEKALLVPIPFPTATPTTKSTPKSYPVENKTQQPLGLGLLGDPSLVFGRKFRWTLGSDRLPENFVKDLKVDYVNQTLEFNYRDIAISNKEGLHAIRWAQQLKAKKLPDEKLVLKTYDGCGTILYSVEFSGLELVEHTTDFDYDSSDVSCQKIKTKFTKEEFNLVGRDHPKSDDDSSKACCPKRPKSRWTMSILDKDEKTFMPERDVTISGRPSMTVEEVEINFLSERFWIPGQSKWEKLTLTIDYDDIPRIATLRYLPDYTVVLNYHHDGKKLETWKLKDAWFSEVEPKNGKCEFVLTYTIVYYEPGVTQNA